MNKRFNVRRVDRHYCIISKRLEQVPAIYRGSPDPRYPLSVVTAYP